jgi:ribosomal-protein-alanine N-acetyltransferase
VIETERLVLRPWREADRPPYRAMMADPEVGYWLGGTRSGEEADAQIDRFEAQLAARGLGFLAMERRSDGAFLGAAGLLALTPENPLAPGVEIGWRLARDAWGAGYATEAARALLADGFDRLGLAEIVAFTTRTNARSRAVMERLGFARHAERDFDHPSLAADHPLRPHVVYVLTQK